MEQQAVLKRHCQNTEDEIIDGLLLRLGLLPGAGIAVEIGANNGYNLSNTRHLADRYGWSLIQIDGNPRHTKVHHAFVTAENVNAVLDECGAPSEFGVLSLDIDGNDWWVWRAIDRRPAVVCIEFNGACPPNELLAVRYDPEFRHLAGDYYGASFAAMRELGRLKGYRYVGHVLSLNAFFVREDLALAAGIEAESEVPPEKHYHPHRDGEWVNPFEEPEDFDDRVSTCL